MKKIILLSAILPCLAFASAQEKTNIIPFQKPIQFLGSDLNRLNTSLQDAKLKDKTFKVTLECHRYKNRATASSKEPLTCYATEAVREQDLESTKN